MNLAEKEIDLLRKNDFHSNVIRYYASERDEEFLYIALELCECTLQEYIEKDLHNRWRPKKNENSDKPGRLEIMDALYQSVDGLKHLHKAGVCHRDIKPSNILIAKSGDGARRIVLSDFGLSKQMPDGAASFSVRSQTGLAGTHGRIAPEVLENYMQSINPSLDPSSNNNKKRNQAKIYQLPWLHSS